MPSLRLRPAVPVVGATAGGHEPAAYACALVNSWPMDFYSPDQVLQDARRHGIEVRPADVRYSDRDCSLEDSGNPQPAIRLGLRMIRGLREDDGQRIETARQTRPFTDVEDLGRRAKLDTRACERLADAGALRGLAGHRHRARWAVAGLEPQLPLHPRATSAGPAAPPTQSPALPQFA